jgi:hypothetical protein
MSPRRNEVEQIRVERILDLACQFDLRLPGARRPTASLCQQIQVLVSPPESRISTCMVPVAGTGRDRLDMCREWASTSWRTVSRPHSESANLI